MHSGHTFILLRILSEHIEIETQLDYTPSDPKNTDVLQIPSLINYFLSTYIPI